MENINITLEEPGISNVDSVLTGPQGPQGEPGEPGRDGVSPTITVGTVTTVASTSPATVTNVGSDTNVILDFGIPRGPQGDPGADGSDGADGADGQNATITIGATETLAPDQSAYVTNVGTATQAILNFGIPQGVQGSSANCLSIPTIVDSLPGTADPNTFYFVPKTYADTTATGNNITMTFTDTGAISSFIIKGTLSGMTPLTGNIDITVDSDTVTIPLASTYLADVNGTYDEISWTGTKWNLIQRIGYIASYDGEAITTDYVCTSGTLTTGDEVYYVLETPETIEINDTNITDPLNAIVTYQYSVGSVTITTSANVTANLEIKYHSYDINNQYDKYLYIIDTANWEKIG